MPAPTILTLVSHYLPAFKAGGPVRSIANLVAHLGEDLDFRIVCADRDLGDEMSFPGIELDRWAPVGAAHVHYTSPASRRFHRLVRILQDTPHDILYLNSFFSQQSGIAPLVARRLGLIAQTPLIIAPRGEFSLGALALKQAKKKTYIRFAKATGLLKGAIWQATSTSEAEDIQRALGNAASQVVVAGNLAGSVNAAPHRTRGSGDPLRLLFLSRVSPKKNLDYALRALARVRVPVSFTVVGPAEDEKYQAECQNLAQQLGPNITVRWLGAIEPSRVPEIMAQHDLFFLPTRGENFGHVIAEALGAGTPVLISDMTPWRGLAALGVGWDLPLSDPAAFAAVIERSAADQPDEAAARRRRAFAYAHQRQKDGADIEANRQLFAAALGRRYL